MKKHKPSSSLLGGVTMQSRQSLRELIFVSFLNIVLIFFIFLAIRLPKQTISIAPTFSTDFAYDNRTFLPAVAENKNIESGSVSKVVILPHHLLASTIIAKGVSSVAGQSPQTIILLSPNHANTGQCGIITSELGWDTPFGLVETDRVILEDFLSSRTVCRDDEAMKVEHGVAGLLPFVKYYLPNTKVVPFILKKDIDPNMINLFTQKIIESTPNVTILVSIDFSHGLSQKDSLKRDSLTQSLISNQNYSELAKLSSEYLDSPLSLITALKIIDSTGSKLEFIDHTDSSVFNRDTKSVTSYFLISGISTSPSPSIIRNLKSDSSSFTLLFAGDVMLGRSVNTRMVKYSDYSWPFRKISDLMSKADLTMVNLESPFRSGCKPTDTGMVFCADPISVEGLITAGVDVANLANNHIDNQGVVGVDETIKILNENHILPIGVSKNLSSKVFEIKNTKIAFLGFDDVQPVSSEVISATPENIKSYISEAKKTADLVVTTFHWGNEYSRHSSRQENLARLAIDSGADLVIGHHPHWVQAFEEYKGKPIYYSLGNLVFDQMWSEETRKGLIVQFTYSGTNLHSREEFPVKIFDYGQPSLFSHP